MEGNKTITTINDYITQFPPEIQQILQQIRAVIHEAAPQAAERIAYAMPTFYLNGNLVHFGAQKNHIGFYPTPSGIEAFREAFAPYPSSKGAVQFPLNQPIPYDLIRKVVEFRVEENLKKAPKAKK